MKREDLESLDLGNGQKLPKEAIDTIMDKHGKAVEANKKELGEVKAERDNLKGQVDTLSKSVDDLKKVDPSKLQEELDKIKKEKEDSDKQYAADKKQLLFDNALELAVANAKSKDSIALKAHLKMDDLKYDEKEGKLIGFDDQLKTIKEADNTKYLFETEPDATGGDHNNLPPSNQTLEEAVKDQIFGKK
jgi:NADH dehydrogenase/NADH:ubiquinone oxidoreductase subunit G